VERFAGCYVLDLPKPLQRRGGSSWEVYLTKLPGRTPGGYEVYFEPPSLIDVEWRLEGDGAEFNWSAVEEGIAFTLRVSGELVAATGRSFGDLIERESPPQFQIGVRRARCSSGLLAAPAASARKRAVWQAQREAQIPTVEGDIRPPVILRRVSPDRDRLLGRQIQQPDVALVELIVTAEGDVSDARVYRPSQPAVVAAVVDAVKQWKFRPATRHGKPLRVRFTVVVYLSEAKPQLP
jgi:TonB family protein